MASYYDPIAGKMVDESQMTNGMPTDLYNYQMNQTHQGERYYDPSTGQMIWGTPSGLSSGNQASNQSSPPWYGNNYGGAGTSGAYSNGGLSSNPYTDYGALLAQLGGGSTYQQRSEAQLQQEAANRYNPIYNANKLAQEQQYESLVAALERQAAQLAPVYERQSADTAESFGDAYSQADRQAASRGMARSSYNTQTLANIDTKGAQAQADIADSQTRANQAIEDQKLGYSSALAQALAQLENDKAASIASYQDQMRSGDYDKYFQSLQYQNQLQLALYELGMQQSQWEQQFAESQRQFNASQAAQSSKAAGGGGGSSTTPKTKTKEDEDAYFKFQLGGLSSLPSGKTIWDMPSGTKIAGVKK